MKGWIFHTCGVCVWHRYYESVQLLFLWGQKQRLNAQSLPALWAPRLRNVLVNLRLAWSAAFTFQNTTLCAENRADQLTQQYYSPWRLTIHPDIIAQTLPNTCGDLYCNLLSFYVCHVITEAVYLSTRCSVLVLSIHLAKLKVRLQNTTSPPLFSSNAMRKPKWSPWWMSEEFKGGQTLTITKGTMGMWSNNTLVMLFHL